MKSQPNRDYQSNDNIQTPPELAKALVQCLEPWGACLEPCRGTGSFWDAMWNQMAVDYCEWCEINEGRDFFDWDQSMDWIITNPPFSMVGDWHEVMFKDPDTNEWGDWMDRRDPCWQAVKKKVKPKDRATRTRIGFMEQSFKVAENVAFLCTLNHLLGLKARFGLLDKYRFGIRAVILLDTPPPSTGWPQAGFQLGAVWFQRGYTGDWKRIDLRGKVKY